jgi:hypothetical protein
MEPYNGYTGKERDAKYQEYKRLLAMGKMERQEPPCQLCGNEECEVEPHSEDYSQPYKWRPPQEYLVCRSCHLWIHKRFSQPDTWNDFKAHVKRGGYASEFASAAVKAERKKAVDARTQKIEYAWKPIEGRTVRQGWWDYLTLDPDSTTARSARPRP